MAISYDNMTIIDDSLTALIMIINCLKVHKNGSRMSKLFSKFVQCILIKTANKQLVTYFSIRIMVKQKFVRIFI